MMGDEALLHLNIQQGIKKNILKEKSKSRQIEDSRKEKVSMASNTY